MQTAPSGSARHASTQPLAGLPDAGGGASRRASVHAAAAAWVAGLTLLATTAPGGAARAATLPFTGTLSVVVGTLDPISAAGAGFASVEPRPGDPNHLATLGLGADVFGATGIVVPVTDPVAFPIGGVVGTLHNAAGSFAEDAGGRLGGALSLPGTVRVCLFGPCSAATANLTVPLGVIGQGGATTVTGAVNLTVVGAPWTTATAAVGSLTARGFAVGPHGAASSTLQTSGSLRLVTPIFLSTNIGAEAVVPAFAFLDLRFVPEPGTTALLVAGITSLLSVAALRRRRG
jgi:hypothetical protein